MAIQFIMYPVCGKTGHESNIDIHMICNVGCMSSGGAPTPAGTSVFMMIKISSHKSVEVKT